MDLPEFKIDSKAGKGLAGGVIGGVVGSAISQGLTTRGEAKRSQIRMTEAEHSAGIASRLMGEQAKHARDWATHVAGMGTPSRIAAGQFQATFQPPKAPKAPKDKESVGAPAPVSTGASTPAEGTKNVPAPKTKKARTPKGSPVQGEMFTETGKPSKKAL